MPPTLLIDFAIQSLVPHELQYSHFLFLKNCV
jgi:hypothetical protein